LEKKLLHLTLKKEWFDLIKSGKKKQEFREFKPYWIKRFCAIDYFEKSKEKPHLYFSNIHGWKTLDKFIGEIDEMFLLKSKQYTSIIFKNGYSKNAPMFKIKCENIEIKRNIETPIGKGNFFVINLGEIL